MSAQSIFLLYIPSYTEITPLQVQLATEQGTDPSVWKPEPAREEGAEPSDAWVRYQEGYRELKSYNTCLVGVTESQLKFFSGWKFERVVSVGIRDIVPIQPQTVLNQRVHVAVPGAELLKVDTVHVKENCCTDQLNDLLQNGWRILAVCVQPDQRRPDYVLGKTTKTDTSVMFDTPTPSAD